MSRRLDVIVLMTGGLEQLRIGDMVRIEAGVALWSAWDSGEWADYIMVNGWTLAYQQLLKWGVPSKHIITGGEPKTTWQQLNCILPALYKGIPVEEMRRWQGKIPVIGLISNSYHLPRIKAILEQDEKKKPHGTFQGYKIKYISAEEIAFRYLKEHYGLDEKQGIHQLKKETCRFV